jgi:hypothetical protein
MEKAPYWGSLGQSLLSAFPTRENVEDRLVASAPEGT